MPIVGRNRKAKPRDVHAVCPNVSKRPRPKQAETFKKFLARLKGRLACDPFLVMLIEAGYGEPTQREYLNRLEDVAGRLYKVRDRLNTFWKR